MRLRLGPVVLRGESPHALGPIGHEFIGVVEEVGAEVDVVARGDLVVAPFTFCDGTCAHCRAGWPSNCVNGGSFGNHGIDGGQVEAVRLPLANATLVKVPGSGHSDETMRSLLTPSDVMGTGHHAAVSAGVKPGMVVAVVGDGAVGLCAIIAARRLGVPTTALVATEVPPPSIAVIRAPDPAEEIREVVRSIARDLDGPEPVPLHRMAILYRQTDPHGPLVRDSLTFAGLPWSALEGRIRLHRGVRESGSNATLDGASLALTPPTSTGQTWQA